MNVGNWRAMQDSIYKQLDTLIILRFRKEMDSLNELQKTPYLNGKKRKIK